MEYRKYPWYEIVKDDSLEQGDIVSDCPVFVAPSDLHLDALEIDEQANPPSGVSFAYQRFDVVVMSQTCDLVKGREKVQEVLLCPLYGRSDFEEGELATQDGWESARKGRFPAYHVLNSCKLSGHESDPSAISFRQVFSLPLSFLRNLVARRDERIRLLPPYREHLSQAFARFFMRVGLPVDIPAFK